MKKSEEKFVSRLFLLQAIFFTVSYDFDFSFVDNLKIFFNIMLLIIIVSVAVAQLFLDKTISDILSYLTGMNTKISFISLF